MKSAHALPASNMARSTYELGLQRVAVAEHGAGGRAHQRQMMRIASIEQVPSQATPWSAACSEELEGSGKSVVGGRDAMAWCLSLALGNCCLHIQAFATRLRSRYRTS